MSTKRRYITVPKTKEASAALDMNEAPDDALLEVQLTEREFEWLVASGTLSAVASRSHCIIDDYEDASITGAALAAAVECLHELAATTNSMEQLPFRVLSFLASEALRLETGLFFFF